jgi:hypothetical protein
LEGLLEESPMPWSSLVSEIDSAIELVLIAIGVETEYRSVITAESEIMNFLRLLKPVWQSNSSMIAIRGRARV